MSFPWKAAVIAAAVAVAVLGVAAMLKQIERSAYERGVQAERARIEEANRDAERRAGEGRRRVEDCPAGSWDREAGKCAQ